MKVRAGKWIMMCLSAMICGDTREVDKVRYVTIQTEKERKEVIEYAKNVGIMLPISWGLEEKPNSKQENILMGHGRLSNAFSDKNVFVKIK